MESWTAQQQHAADGAARQLMLSVELSTIGHGLNEALNPSSAP
jgi:hypothetical protein